MSLIPESVHQKLVDHRRIVITAIILLIFILLISFVPTYVARHLVSSTLNDFGIEHEGIKTVKINPWKREVWAGPVRFRAGDSDPGQLGEVGIKINIFPVFRKRAMVESVLIRGIDIVVARTEDNAITLNGIPLDQFTPTTETPESAEPEKETKPWGTGLGNFEMQNSRLLLRRKTGATLAVEIESFKLSEFESWHPDDPGTFELKARANDIELDLKGLARPFAQHITLEVDTNTREASLDKIIDFVGPLNLERHGGVYHSSTQNEITLFDSGRIEGHSVGKVTLTGADYAQADRFAFAAEQADIDLDVTYSLSENEDVQLDGQLTLDMANASGKLSDGDPFSIGNLSSSFTGLSALRAADESIKFFTKHKVEAKNLAFSGRVNLSMDAFTDVLRILQSISAKKEISEKETGLDKFAGDEVTLPKADITVEQINASVSKLELNSANGNVSLDIVLENKAKGLKVATSERATNVEAVDIKIDTLRLKSGEGKTGLAVTGSSAVSGTRVRGPIGTGSIKTVKVSENIELKINRGDIALQGKASADILKTQLHAQKTETLPEAIVKVDKVSADVQKVTFSTQQQQVKWQVLSGASIDHASASYAEGEMTSAKIQKLEWRGASADQNLNIATEALTISGLEASTTRQFIDGLIGEKPGKASTTQQEDSDEDNGDGNKPTPAKPDKDDPDANNVKLGRFELINGAKLHFLDKKVLPPIVVDLHIKEAEVHGIDSWNPKSKARINLLATINEFTSLELDGKADNVGPKVNMELNSSLKNLELPPYSSYVAEFGGVNMKSGQFNTDAAIKANEGVLDGAIKLHIKDLEFTPLSGADAERLSKRVGVPIETAVKLLKDPKGNIELALPVSGTATEPSVDISSAINKAIKNTLKAVFPPTLIASMLSSVKEGGSQNFKPVIFKAGSSELNNEATKYLDELATLLKERPSLSLNICGRATPDDFKEMTLISIKLPADAKPDLIEERQRLINTHSSKLVELATERTRTVRRYLITDKGLNAAQVGECRLSFNPEDTEPPRVIVTL
ncbi:DUF748 domain-containing protein [Kaarinaea lacus]